MLYVGKRIKELRTQNKLTQAQLANEIFVTDKAVSKWEQEKGNPDLETLLKIANYFDVSLNYLVEGKEFVKQYTNSGDLNENEDDTFDDLDIDDLDNIGKATKEAKRLLRKSGVGKKLNYISAPLEWVLTAIIGLVYHRFINKKGDDFCYQDIFFYINDLVNQYASDIDKDFVAMQGDLYESFGEYKIPNHDYADRCLGLWDKFRKIYYGADEATANGINTVLLDIVSKNSSY